MPYFKDTEPVGRDTTTAESDPLQSCSVRRLLIALGVFAAAILTVFAGLMIFRKPSSERRSPHVIVFREI